MATGTSQNILQSTQPIMVPGTLGSQQLMVPGSTQPLMVPGNSAHLMVPGASQPLVIPGTFSQPLTIPQSWHKPVMSQAGPIVSVPTLPVGLGGQIVTSVVGSNGSTLCAGFPVPNMAQSAVSAINPTGYGADSHNMISSIPSTATMAQTGMSWAKVTPTGMPASVVTPALSNTAVTSALVNLISSRSGPILHTADPPVSLVSVSTPIPTPIAISTTTSHNEAARSYSPQVMLKIPQVTLSSAGLRTVSSSNMPDRYPQGHSHDQGHDLSVHNQIKTEPSTLTTTSTMLSPTSPLDLRMDTRRAPVTSQQSPKEMTDAKCALLQLAEVCRSFIIDKVKTTVIKNFMHDISEIKIFYDIVL